MQTSVKYIAILNTKMIKMAPNLFKYDYFTLNTPIQLFTQEKIHKLGQRLDLCKILSLSCLLKISHQKKNQNIIKTSCINLHHIESKLARQYF